MQALLRLRAGERRRDQFDELHQGHWVKEVEASDAVGALSGLGELMDGNRRCV